MPIKYYLIVCGVLSLVSFVLFAVDKAAAADGRTRIPEISLLTLSALGGGVGAMLGKILLHHKSNVKRKLHFAVVLTTSVVTQVGFLIYLALVAFSII